jgi:nitroimidazol reductase NimA-like FMN-containing flavoprotein (pyridoxamine 5'-phosphate oxidase superfamily)
MAKKFPGEDSAALQRLISDMPAAHVAFVENSQPVVLPIAIAYDRGSILLHGSTGSRWLRLIAGGTAVSLAVTALDGLVVARSAFESSMHYRSAVLFGSCAEVAPSEQEQALDLLTDALIPNRVGEVRRPHSKELAATLVVRMTVAEWTYKLSDGWPDDPPEDVQSSTWAGVLPRTARYERADPAPDLRSDADLPASVRALLGD